MLKYQIYSENEWIYPDTELDNPFNQADIYAAKNSTNGFQILTNYTLTKPAAVTMTSCGLDITLYQSLPVIVDENSGAKLFTTTDYDSVKDFVTRKAPFEVYERTREVNNELVSGRLAFYVRVNVPSDAETGDFKRKLNIKFNDKDIDVDISLKIYDVTVPELKNSAFHMINWLKTEEMIYQHNLTFGTEDYIKTAANYIDNQLDMRNDYLMLPSGEPVRDENGKVIDFDFSDMELIGKIAVEKGFKYVMGGFIARFIQWDDKEIYLLWDRDVSVISFEAYRQMKIYFEKISEIIDRNGWRDCYMQCLVDEPQFPNSEHYRILSCVCRKFLKGIPINDPVETTDIEGAVDVWVVKQAVYEKHIEKYRQLQALGEKIWLYTCGFPAGSMMNRVVDLPLLVSRLPMWMCYEYGAKGFLHWGYNVHNKTTDGEKHACYSIGERSYPSGNSYVVYPAENKPDYGIRGHLQRAGAEDYELLYLLGLKDEASAHELIHKVCASFDDYNACSVNFDNIRHELLEMLTK